MSAAVIVGASVAGLATALALAQHGRRVLILERASPPPLGPVAEAAGRWRRGAVPQADHSHILTSRGVGTLRDRAPDLLGMLDSAGGRLLDLTTALPPTAAGPRREPPDAELVALACRRSLLELVLYRYVTGLAGVRVEHGVTVTGVERGVGGRLTGVTTASGRFGAQIVVDASGRAGAARGWITTAGLPVPPDQVRPAGLRTFSRFYQRGDGQLGPLNRGNAAGLVSGHYAGVLHPADGNIFSIALGSLPEDRALRALHDPPSFTAVARSTPWVRDWLADGSVTPLTPIRAATGPDNVLRGVAVASQSPLAGLFPVGDAACTTNPLYGRGMSLALAHAFALADVLAGAPGADLRGAGAAGLADALYRPWFEQSAIDDAERVAGWRAAAGLPATPAAPTVPARPAGRPALAEIGAAAASDAAVWRGFTRVMMGLRSPTDVFDDPDFRRRVRDAQPAPAARPPGPRRGDLLAALAQAAA
ncbi:2-polyprenyl-6-methoxyphenol hydroxylase-like oxidoreductase [Frankia torreyi]|uniref:2-polyprenyl-6-methoxyphenol hydroxylase-like oxidoreductase n=2 Tax=Frankia torreyi TaxID=1856 RepID=A0A0D8BAT7_9ACTN|nr:2-polyprenyl-6-methoxyphenol hydroxylase-like oxidoreductase [Frankia torreyi]